MDDTLDSLLKNKNGREKNLSSKELSVTKRGLNGICKTLIINSKEYSPKKTAEKVQRYIETKDKVDRILYSEISAFIVGLGEEDRGTFNTNIEKLLLYVLDDLNGTSEEKKLKLLKKETAKFLEDSNKDI